MRKKKWTTPLFTVLVKSKPEEAVLAACKGSAYSSMAHSQSNCYAAGGAPYHACATGCANLTAS